MICYKPWISIHSKLESIFSYFHKPLIFKVCKVFHHVNPIKPGAHEMIKHTLKSLVLTSTSTLSKNHLLFGWFILGGLAKVLYLEEYLFWKLFKDIIGSLVIMKVLPSGIFLKFQCFIIYCLYVSIEIFSISVAVETAVHRCSKKSVFFKISKFSKEKHLCRILQSRCFPMNFAKCLKKQLFCKTPAGECLSKIRIDYYQTTKICSKQTIKTLEQKMKFHRSNLSKHRSFLVCIFPLMDRAWGNPYIISWGRKNRPKKPYFWVIWVAFTLTLFYLLFSYVV